MSIDITTSVFNDRSELNKWKPYIDRTHIRQVYVYEKDSTMQYGDIIQIAEEEYRIANFGKCEYAFLLHIITNYDDLADYNIFTKCNLDKERINIHTLIDRCRDFDYCETGGLLKHQYFNANHPPTIDTPDTEILYGFTHEYAETLCNWVAEIFGPHDAPQHSTSFVWGPCFCVSKRLIHRYPKTVYEWFCNKYLPSSGSWDVIKASAKGETEQQQICNVGSHYHDNYLRFWKILFTQPSIKYPLTTNDVHIGSV